MSNTVDDNITHIHPTRVKVSNTEVTTKTHPPYATRVNVSNTVNDNNET